MIDAELGKKLVCPSCSVKFYDLGKDPAECPKCDTIFSAEPILPSKEDRPPATEIKPKEVTEEKTAAKKDDDSDEAEVVSLEDLVEEEDDDGDDDELAAVKDVDLGDGDKNEPSTGEDDDSFLEIDDGESSNVSDIVGVASGDEEN